jgi:hypothetical protein
VLLTHATVRIAQCLDPAQDLLVLPAFAASLGISGSYDAAKGVLSLSGTASPANYQAVLRGVAYENDSDAPSTATRKVTFEIGDATSSRHVSVDVKVVAIDDAPVVTTSGLLEYSSGHANPIDPLLTVRDVDSAHLRSAQVRITGGYHAGQDFLAVAPGFLSGLSARFDASTGMLTLSGNSSVQTWENVLRHVTYTNNAAAPTPADLLTGRTISFVVNDGTLPSHAQTVHVDFPSATPPVISAGSAAAAEFTEGGPAVVADPTLTLSGASQLDGATVRFVGYQAGDVLEFTAAGAIAGRFDAGTGTLALSGAANAADYQAVLRSVTYSSTSDNPSSDHLIGWKVTSGAASSAELTTHVNVTGVNDPPVLNIAGGVMYAENAAPTPVASGALVSDVDSADFGGGSLTVGITANGTAADQLSIIDSGPTPGQIGLSGNIVAYGGVPIGTFSGGANGTDLVIDFGPYAPRDAVQALARAIAFSNASDNPSTQPRTLSFTLVDGDGGTDTTTATTTAGITPTPDAPALSASGIGAICSEGGAPVIVDGGFTIHDVDGTPLQGATVTISGNFQGGDTLAFTDTAQITGQYGAVAGVLTLTGAATAADYEAALRTVTFAATGDESPPSRSIDFAVNIGSAESNHAGSDVTVTPTNDPPVLTLDPVLSYTENDGPTLIAAGATLADVDSADFSGGSLTVTFSANGTGADQLAIVDQGTAVGRIGASGGSLSYGGAVIGSYSGGANGADLVVSFTGSAATPDAVQALARAISFANTSDNPVTLQRTVTFTVNDGDGGSAAASSTIGVTRVNDAPVLTISAGNATWTEGANAITVAGIAISDPDSSFMSSARVAITGNYQAGDSLVLTNTSVMAGSWDAATGVLTLAGGSPTLEECQAALRSVKFVSSNDNPAAVKTVSFTVNDFSGAASMAVTRDIAITPVNDAPGLAIGSTLAFTEGDAAAAIAPTATVGDPDSADFDGGTLTVRISQGGTIADQLAILDEGTGAGQIGVSGSEVTYGGATIASFSGGVNGTDLVISFTGAGATPEAVQELTRAITFDNTSDNPSTVPRTVRFTLTDGDGGTGSAATTVQVTPVNDAPVITPGNGTAAWTEGAGAAPVDTGIVVADPDSVKLQSARVSISGNFESGDTLLFGGAGFIAGSYDPTTGVMTLTNPDTVAQYQAALRSISFQTASEHPAAVKTISLVVNDGSADSAVVTRDITLTSVNDPPALAVGVAPVQGVRTKDILVAPTATLSDVDSPDFNGGLLTIHLAANVAATDRLSVVNEGTAAGQIGVSGSNVTYGGATIGTFSGGDNGSDLVVTFTSAAATQTAVQELVRDIAYNETSGTFGGASTRDVSFTLVDGDGGSDTASATASVTLVEAAPVLTVSGTTALAYTENDAPAAVRGGIVVTDLDTPSLQGASVAISSNYASGQDVLAFTATGNISGSFDGATGVLTLSGSDTLANYQTALQSVFYANTSDTPSILTRTISFQVQDDPTNLQSNVVTRNVTVTAVNDAPVLTVPTDASVATAFSNTTLGVVGVSVADKDAGNASVQTRVTVTNGSATFDLSGGATVFSGANGSGDVTLKGSVAQVNQALATMSFQSTDGFTGAATVTVATTDLGNSGSGGAKTDTESFHIGVVPQVFVIDNTAGTSVATFNALSTPGAGDYIYVMYGTGTYSASGGFNLQANQHLYGQGQTLQFTNPVTGEVVTIGSGASVTTPTISITGVGSHAVDLSTGNQITGINFATTATSQTAISDNGVAVGNLTINDVDVTGSGQAVKITNGGSLDVAFDTLSSSGGAYGVILGGALTGTFTAASGTLSGHSNSEFGIDGGAAAISYAGAVGNGSGSSVTIANLTGGFATFSGNITDSNDAGGGISVTNSAGTVTFSGASDTLNTGASAGVTLTGNTGTVDFTNGGLNVTTTAGAGFNATGGTVNVTGAGNIISTGTGTALDISNATIGANDVTFQSISSNGAVNGIVLNNTGSSGGLNVTGTGTTAGSGGTLQASTGSGISLTSTLDVNLNNMVVKTSAGSGIAGTGVTNFSLDGSSIVNNGNSAADDGIQLYSATGNAVAGTVSITDSDVSGNAQFDVHIGNATGTIGSLTVSNNTFAGVSPTWGAGLFRVDASGSSAIGSATMNQDTFSGNAGSMGLAVAAGGTAAVSNFTVTNGTFSNTGTDAGFIQSGLANLDFNLRNNTMTLATNDAVLVSSDAASTGGSITGEISGNRIGATGAGSSGGSGIDISLQGRTAGTLQVSSNTIGAVASDGIDALFQTTGGTTHNLTITNNTIGPNNDVAGFGIYASLKGTGLQTVKANITGNTLNFDNLLYQNADPSGTAQLLDTPPASATAAAQLQSANFGNTPGFSTQGTVTLFTGGVSLPPILVAPGEMPPPASGAASVTQAELESTLAAAIVRWEQAGLSGMQDSLLHLATIAAAPIGHGELAEASGTTVLVDPDAGGYGWFADATPLDDSEFAYTPDAAAAGHMDLLTAVMHELGHVLGLPDQYGPADASALMYGYLEVGERRLPEPSDVALIGLAMSSPTD